MDQNINTKKEGIEELLTVREITTKTKLSKQTITRAIHAGELKAQRFGKAFRVSVSAYLEWQEEKTYSPDAVVLPSLSSSQKPRNTNRFALPI